MSKVLPVRRASLWSLLRRALGGVGLGLTVSASPALAQSTAGQPVPPHWIGYAQRVSHQFQDRLGDPGNEAVVRLHAWMQERLLEQAQPDPAPPLVVRVWVAPAGQVARLEFDSLGQPQADTDLRALLTSEPLLEPPPSDMRQPMVLQLTLGFISKG